jgi:hypothetical protein
MKPLRAIAKSIDKSKDLKKYKTQVDEAVSKAKKADADALAKKAKEAEDKKKAAEKAKKLYEEGVKAGKKKGAKSVKRKIVAGAAVTGAAYYEGKTGNISKAAKAAKDMYDKRNAKPTNAKGAPLKTKGSQTPSWRSKQGVKGNLKNSKK